MYLLHKKVVLKVNFTKKWSVLSTASPVYHKKFKELLFGDLNINAGYANYRERKFSFRKSSIIDSITLMNFAILKDLITKVQTFRMIILI